MKQRSTNPELLKAHDEAWKALKVIPLYVEIEKLFNILGELETWHLERENFEEHNARYDAGKPHEIWAKLQSLQLELHKTAEHTRWFELYNQLYA